MMLRNGVHRGSDTVMLADVAEIGDSPLMRAMRNELVDRDTLAGLVSIASYETCLD